MNKKISLLGLFGLSLVITACQTPIPDSQEILNLDQQWAEESAAVEGVVEESEPEQNESIEKPEPIKETGVKLYKGSFFDIQYPKAFTARPTEPVEHFWKPEHEDAIERFYVLTDEAYFTSSDERVEFFVFSPLWAGDPENYLEIAENEELVDEKIEEYFEVDDPSLVGDSRIRWVTVKAKDDSYYRSFVSKKEQIGVSEIHHVFGIKYQDAKALEEYREEYEVFKESLVQYADA